MMGAKLLTLAQSQQHIPNPATRNNRESTRARRQLGCSNLG